MPDAQEDLEDEDYPEEDFRRYVYTFEEFQRHLKDVHARRMENASEDEDGGAFFRNAIRVNRYFSEFYDFDEASQKASIFFVALSHVSKHMEDYDSEMFGIVHDGGILVSEALQRGVHWYYAVRDRADWGPDKQAVPIIKQFARQWIEDQGEQGAAHNGA